MATFYDYENRTAFDPHTQQGAPNATGSVYAKTDTTFSAPLTVVMMSSGLQAMELTSDQYSQLPGFQVEDHLQVVFKSGDFTKVLNTTTPLVGPAGPAVSEAVDNGDNTVTFLLEDGSPAVTVTLPASDVPGPPGDKGEPGDQGLPGVNAVPADEAVGTYATTPGTKTHDALTATIAGLVASPVDRGQALTAKLEIGSGDATVALLGDSTGNKTTEWFYKTMTTTATNYPLARIEYKLWSDASQAYAAAQVIQEGGTPDPAPVETETLRDTFTRTVADVKGSTLDVGGVWTGPFSNSTGKYSADGTKAKYNGTDGTTGELIATGALAGSKHVVSATFTMPTNNATARTIRLFGKYVNTSSYIYINGNVGSSSAFIIAKRIGDVTTQIAAWDTSPVPVGSASETFTATLTVDGTAVTGTINGVSVTATLTEADVTALSGAKAAGFLMAVTGASMDNFSLKVTAPAASTARTVNDTFTRTGDVKGSTPDTGGAWGGASNATGVYTADGSKLVSSGATGATLVSDGGSRGNQTVAASFVIDTNATGGRWVRLLGKYLSENDYIYISGNIGGSWTIQQRIGGALTQIAAWGTPPVAIAAGTSVTMSLNIAGTSVSATINGNTVTGSISQATADILSPATQAGFGLYVPNATMDNFTVDVELDRTAEQTITFYNGSHPGSKLEYQETRLATMLPVEPDLLFLSSCHNYGASGAAAYRDILAAFIDKVRAIYPQAGIVLSSQNPQKSPATNKLAHLSRMTIIRPLAEARGYGYIPAAEAFRSQPDKGDSLVMADGIHPTPEGSDLWAGQATAYLDGLALR